MSRKIPTDLSQRCEQKQQHVILSTNPTQKRDNGKLTTNSGDKGEPTAELWNSLFKKREQLHPEATAD